MTNKKVPFSSKKFECNICDYSTSRKSQYDRHLSTGKHKILTNTNEKVQLSSNIYSCICGKTYKHSSSLCGHKKTCNYTEEEKTNGQNNGGINNELVVQIMNNVIAPLVKQSTDLQNLVVPLVKQSNDLQELVVKEIIPKIGNTNCNNTTNNTTNNKFNLSIYLNEKCKDAIPLVEFIENLKITDNDYDTTRTEGIVSGLTDIFTKELRNLDVRQLPIHCSDLKRETFYIKNDDEWVKDDSEKTILSKAICTAKDKANKFLPRWLEDHPLCWKQDNNYHTQWMDIVTVRYGKGDPNFNEKNTRKILKNLAQEVVIDKETAMIDEE